MNPSFSCALQRNIDGIVERFYAELDVDDATICASHADYVSREGMVNMVGTTARVASTLARYSNQYRII